MTARQASEWPRRPVRDALASPRDSELALLRRLEASAILREEAVLRQRVTARSLSRRREHEAFARVPGLRRPR